MLCRSFLCCKKVRDRLVSCFGAFDPRRLFCFLLLLLSSAPLLFWSPGKTCCHMQQVVSLGRYVFFFPTPRTLSFLAFSCFFRLFSVLSLSSGGQVSLVCGGRFHPLIFHIMLALPFWPGTPKKNKPFRFLYPISLFFFFFCVSPGCPFCPPPCG